MRTKSRLAAVLSSGALVASGLAATVVAAPPALASANAEHGTVSTRPSDRTPSFVDGVVYSIAQVGPKVVVGGTFTKVGPGVRGAAGVVDVAGSTFGASFPDVAGAVYAAASDGAGGWYLAGDFTSVGGQQRGNLAQVGSTGAVTAWAPVANGPVRALVVGSDGVYVGGDFTTLSGSAAGGLGKLDGSGGTVWGATAGGGGVRALALSGDGSTVYVGGAFTSLAGVSTLKRLGAVSAAAGTAVAGFAPGTVNQTVFALSLVSGSLWLGGDFTAVNGTTRQHLAQVDPTTGALGTIAVSVNGHVNQLLADSTGTKVLLGGSFATVGGLNRPHLASLDASTGAVGSLSFPVLTGDVSGMALDGTSGLDVTGSFTLNPERTAPAVLARIDLSTLAVTTVVPYQQTPKSLARTPRSGTSGGRVLVRVGGSLLVAGDFSDYGVVARTHLAAYDLATGALDLAFDPAPDGDYVHSLKGSADGQSVFVGGSFGTIGGVGRRNLAKLSLTGAVDRAFDPSPDAFVKDMAVRADGTALYVGGDFDAIAGQPMTKLAGIDPSTGTLLPGFQLPLTEPTNDASEGGARALALSPDQTRLMVIGNFAKIGGVDRPLIAQVDVSQATAKVTAWRTTVYDQPCARGRKGWMRDVDISPDGATAYVVSSGHIYYPACDTVNAFPMASGQPDVQPLWSTKIGDTIEAVAATGDGVYIGGHFRYIETETLTQKHFQLAVLDPATGGALNWEPNAGGFLGVKVIESLPAGVFVGSDGDTMGGVAHGRFGFFAAPAPGVEVRKLTSTPWVIAPGQPVTFSFTVKNTYGDRPITLTGLSDTRLGNLGGVGTCALPQTIAAYDSYTCTATDQVNGAAQADVPATVTATANNGTATVTDTDTSDVEVESSEPTFRLRLSSGPWTVTYPQGEVGYGASFLNIDTRNPITVTALTSPQYGDLSSACSLPLTIQPNKLAYCHLNLPVGGDVGAKPSFAFTATATTAIGTVKSNGSASITILPPASGTPLLYVVGNAALLTSPEAAVRTRLAKAYNVTTIDDDALTPAAVQNQGLVVVQGSVLESKVALLKSLGAPLLVLRNRLLDELGMSTVAGQGQGNVTAGTMVTPMHPLSAALNGAVAINSAAKVVYWASPGTATSIQQVAAGQSVEFVYQPGATMADGSTAADCRVYLNGTNTSSFTASEWALFDRAAAYGSTGCGSNMLWTAIGSGGTAYPGDGFVSTAVGLNQPWGVAVSAAGEVYVADSSNNRVVKVASNGIVTTVAGTGTAGYNGDNVAATTARLSAPARLAFDATGNLFIADSGNNRIRKVTPGGTISTVAGNGQSGSQGDGGQATSARLKSPFDVFPAGDGSLYIADRGNQKVRKVSPTGVITTVAGTGTAGYNGDNIAATSARLNNPYSVALDGAGNLYVADYDNERVRIVSPGGTIDTFAGIGVATANGDGGPADEAGLHKPDYVEVLPNGSVLVSEVNNDRVRLVQDGIITTLAGTGQFGYVGDGGPPTFSTWQRPAATAVDSRGNLWIVDRNNHRVRVIDAG